MPKIDVTQELLDMNENPIMGPPSTAKDGTPTPMTVRSACIQALLTADEKQTGQHKFDAYQLAQKIQEEDNPMIEAQKIQVIKDAVGRVFFPIIIGRVWDALELKTPKAVPNLPTETEPTPETEDTETETPSSRTS